jgi:hypothetical protein
MQGLRKEELGLIAQKLRLVDVLSLRLVCGTLCKALELEFERRFFALPLPRPKSFRVEGVSWAAILVQECQLVPYLVEAAEENKPLFKVSQPAPPSPLFAHCYIHEIRMRARIIAITCVYRVRWIRLLCYVLSSVSRNVYIMLRFSSDARWMGGTQLRREK